MRPRYDFRSDQTRLPKDASKREALTRQIGTDGYQFLAWVQTAATPLAKSALVSYIQTMNHIYNSRYSVIVVLHATR